MNSPSNASSRGTGNDAGEGGDEAGARGCSAPACEGEAGDGDRGGDRAKCPGAGLDDVEARELGRDRASTASILDSIALNRPARPSNRPIMASHNASGTTDWAAPLAWDRRWGEGDRPPLR